MNRRQKGFSLLELLVAMTILAVLGSIGFVQLRKHSAQARHLKAADTLRTVSSALDQYYLKPNRGYYPELASWQAMIEPNSPLVKESLLPTNLSATDPWGNPFEGSATKAGYTLKCGGDPSDLESFPPITKEAGKVMETGAAPAVPGEAAAGGSPK